MKAWLLRQQYKWVFVRPFCLAMATAYGAAPDSLVSEAELLSFVMSTRPKWRRDSDDPTLFQYERIAGPYVRISDQMTLMRLLQEVLFAESVWLWGSYRFTAEQSAMFADAGGSLDRAARVATSLRKRGGQPAG
jgi:hypothetical protein